MKKYYSLGDGKTSLNSEFHCFNRKHTKIDQNSNAQFQKLALQRTFLEENHF